MTGSSRCPAWCSDKYPADDPNHIHVGPLTAVMSGRAKSEASRLELPSILVRAILPDYQVPAKPSVLVLTTEGNVPAATVRHREAVGFAAVIDTLAAATSAQHREVAAAIRQAAALIEGEASADD
jgi:hypothetical protein